MRIIFCKFFKKILEGQEYKIYPGKIGEEIYQHISKKAWKKWISQQTKIINEKKLNMNHSKDYKEIEKNMISFLFHNSNHLSN
ncbi:oxidative damage protection protein [Buchnera aphidicola]|uniref:oxidative damage protection protein n=1 Tax=Buchnera aphidicola TaxID=9 RepID=UPI0034640319